MTTDRSAQLDRRPGAPDVRNAANTRSGADAPVPTVQMSLPAQPHVREHLEVENGSRPHDAGSHDHRDPDRPTRPVGRPDGRHPDPLEIAIRHGLAAGEFDCHIRPRYELATGRLVALVARPWWNHRGSALLWPHDFMASATHNGLAGAAFHQALDAACRGFVDVCESTKRSHRPARLAFGVTDGVCEHPRLITTVLGTLADHGLRPDQLTLEIEGTELLDPAHRAAFGRLSDAGIRLAVADFGNGRADVAMLWRLPIAEIRLSRDLTATAGADPTRRAVLLAIVGAAHAMGVEVGADADTAADVDRLHRLGVDHAQGAYWATPARVGSIRSALMRPTRARANRRPRRDPDGHERAALVWSEPTDSRDITAIVDGILRALGEFRSIVVIADSDLHADIDRRLTTLGDDLGDAWTQRQVIHLDSVTALNSIMPDGWPQRARIAQLVDRIIDQTGRHAHLVVQLGGHVARAGRPEASIEFERLWHEVIGEHRFDAVCVHDAPSGRAMLPGQVSRLCAIHGDAAAPSSTRLRSTAGLSLASA